MRVVPSFARGLLAWYCQVEHLLSMMGADDSKYGIRCLMAGWSPVAVNIRYMYSVRT
jgi:hypothetical protein